MVYRSKGGKDDRLFFCRKFDITIAYDAITVKAELFFVISVLFIFSFGRLILRCMSRLFFGPSRKSYSFWNFCRCYKVAILLVRGRSILLGKMGRPLFIVALLIRGSSPQAALFVLLKTKTAFSKCNSRPNSDLSLR